MSTTVPTFATPARPRVPIRPLALPTEHGGWGFLFEPIVLALIVAPSLGGALVALAFILGFLTRQPLKFALQDALRGRSYPRTRVCWLLASGYAASAGLALAAAVAVSGWAILIPIGLVAPLGLLQIFYDANNRSRVLLPELGGAAAMASSAAAIALAGGMRLLPALTLSGVLIARFIPAIVYVRTLVIRSHKQQSASGPAIALHAIAIPLVAWFAPPLAAVAMALLFARAVCGLARPVPPAKKIGWTEITWGAATVAMLAVAFF